MYVCQSVCHGKLQIDSSFLFLDRIELFFGHHLSIWHSTKCCSIIDVGPLMPKIYSPKFYRPLFTGAAIGQTCTHTCVMAATGNLYTQRLACGADLCCHGNDICTRRRV